MPLNDPNLGLAFLLTFAAGAATALGAAVVFVPRLVRLASRRTLAAALALSAGVMTYVSFVEILVKSLSKFREAGFTDNVSYSYVTLCFFAGVVIMMILNFIVTALLGQHHHHHHNHNHEDHLHDSGDDCCFDERDNRTTRRSSETGMENNDATTMHSQCNNDSAKEAEEQESLIMTTAAAQGGCPCCSDDPVGDLERLQRMAQEMEEKLEEGSDSGNVLEDENFQDVVEPSAEGEPQQSSSRTGEDEKRDVENLITSEIDTAQEGGGGDEEEERRQHEQQKLLRMSLNTAIAIGLHNFPEGLATFLSTLADPSVGVVLAIAIAIHNIPEGICVAMPVYYATGSRWKAFGWAILSGLSEPFAALLGWAVLAGFFSNTLYAVLFGIVAGMMVIISMRELLPTAHRYDPEDRVVTYFFILGMAIMALSLVLFMI